MIFCVLDRQGPRLAHLLSTMLYFFISFSGPNPTPNTRKFFKKQCDDLGRNQMPDEEILKKRAKLDESFIASTNPELSGNKKVLILFNRFLIARISRDPCNRYIQMTDFRQPILKILLDFLYF